MKKIFVLWLFLCVVDLTSAQTQQGYVKTRGRMVNGKHVPGVGLPGATVTIQGKGTVAVQKQDGAFSFPVPAKTFLVEQVQKKGYELVDVDATRKPYTHSPNPLYLVMETPEQKMEDQLEAEEKISRTLREQLKKARTEIQRLKDENKISEEEYRQRIAQLMKEQESNKALIASMAKEYAQIDYDQMDSLNRRISDAILNGRLTEADSLLRSKGDMRSRIADIRQKQQAEAQEEKELAQRQENLTASKVGTQKKLEDVATDCYQFFDRFKLENLHDSAAYYIELRAELDTTNADWQFEAGCYFLKQNQFARAEPYYEEALEGYRCLARSNPQAYEPDLAMTLNNLAVLYNATQRFSESEAMYKEALEIYRRLARSNPQAYEPDLAMTLNNLAYLYSGTQRFSESETKYKEALDIRRRLARSNSQAYEPDLAMTLNNLALLYSDTQRFSESEATYKEALEIHRRLARSNPQAYEPDLAKTLNNLANLYKITQRFSEGETMYKEALEIYRRLARFNPQAYEPDLAKTLNNLAYLYSGIQCFSEGETMYKEALEICRCLARSNPQAYEPYLAGTLNNLANLYEDTQRFSESEATHKEALEIRRRLACSNPQAYEPDLAMTLNNLAYLYSGIQRFSEGETMYKKALEIYRRLARSNPNAYEPGLAMTLNNLAGLYWSTQHFSESEAMHKEALEIRRRLARSNPQAYEPDLAMTLNNLAGLYRSTQRFSESEAMYKEVLDIYRRLANSNPQTYELNVSQTCYNYGLLKLSMKQYMESISMFEEALQIYRKIAKSNPVQQNMYEGSLYWLGLLYSDVGNHTPAYEIYEELLPLLEVHYQQSSEQYKEDFVLSLGNQSFHCIIMKKYAQAEKYARKGLAIDSTLHWIASNLAPALLFQGKYTEAEQVYRQYKAELKESFLDDFKAFSEAGVIPKEYEVDVEKIKKILNE